VAAVVPGHAAAPAVPAVRTRRREWLAALATAARTPRGAIGLALAGLIIAVAVIGPYLAPHGIAEIVGPDLAKPSAHFPLGTDYLGRDVLSRVLAGGWVLLIMAAAYLRGVADGAIMRTVDVILAFPQLVFALLLLSILGPKLWLITLAVGITHAPQVGRVIRAATLDVSEQDYVKAVELQGMRPARVMAKEILPNLVTPLMVEIGLRLTYSIIIIAGLAFLGFGQNPPAASWGELINDNRAYLAVNPWAVIAPAVLIALLTIGVNTYSDAIARVAIGVDRRPEEAALLDDLGPREAA
jgi:peptide/nickel transport system permease protein